MDLDEGTHGVIAIHGKSMSLKCGDFLTKLTTFLYKALSKSPSIDDNGHPIWPIIERDIDINTDTNQASATLRIKSPDKSKTATWVFKEVYWDNTFPAPSSTTVLRWLWLNIKALFKHLIEGYFWTDPANDRSWDRDKRSQSDIKQSWWITVCLFLKLFVARFVTLIIIPLSPLVFCVCWLLKGVGKIEEFLSYSMGDYTGYISNEEFGTPARSMLEDEVIKMLKDDEIEDITIVAKSLGAVVTYETLREGGKIGKEFARKSKKLTLVTVGSALNLVMGMVRDHKDAQIRKRFEKPFSKAITGNGGRTNSGQFFWLDIYARFDWVPGGPLNDWIIEQADIDLKEQAERRMVINLDSGFRDHDYYLSNTALVAPRIAKCINRGEYPWKEAGITPAKVRWQTRKAALTIV